MCDNPSLKQSLGLGGGKASQPKAVVWQGWRVNIDRSPIRSQVTTPKKGCGVKSGGVESGRTHESEDMRENVGSSCCKGSLENSEPTVVSAVSF